MLQAAGLFPSQLCHRLLLTALDMVSTAIHWTALYSGQVGRAGPDWVAVSLLDSPAPRSRVEGRRLVVQQDTLATFLFTRTGQYSVRQFCTRDYSHCKPSKYS